MALKYIHKIANSGDPVETLGAEWCHSGSKQNDLEQCPQGLHTLLRPISVRKSIYHLVSIMKNMSNEFPTRLHTNQVIQPKKMAGGLTFRILEVGRFCTL